MLEQASTGSSKKPSGTSAIGAATVGFTAPRIEDHALIGNLQTAALVTLDGTVDWLCFPRFDSDACFAALLGTEDHGCWKIFPRLPVTATKRRYRGDSLILETEWTTSGGTVRMTDFMPPGNHNVLVRVVECVQGRVPMCSRVVVRFGYGQVVPQFQIMYGLRGERRLTELSLDWLPGYGGSTPVRTGNGAYTQYQLDVMGEVASSMYTTARLKGKVDPQMERAFIQVGNYICGNWTRLDRGLWEMRGPDRAFTASKVAAWQALDSCTRAARAYGLDAPCSRWAQVQAAIHDEVCAKGFDAKRNTFTQYYGSEDLDASLLFIPLTGFLPPDDPRCVGTIDAVARELMEDGLLLRYRPKDGNDGLRGTEGAFLACSFWLVQAYCYIGRLKEAEALFERLAALCNDVGLLAEEYDPKAKRQLGNFPQAFSHLALIQAAFDLDEMQQKLTTH